MRFMITSSTYISATHTTKVLKAVFPRSERKRASCEKHCYYTRITCKDPPVSSHPQPPPQLVGASQLQPSLFLGLVPVTQSPPASPIYCSTTCEELRAGEPSEVLEERTDKVVSAVYIRTGSSIPCAEGQVVYGPEHFTSFSLEQVSQEVQSGAPTLYGLMKMLCDTRRNAQDDGGNKELWRVMLPTLQLTVTKG